MRFRETFVAVLLAGTFAHAQIGTDEAAILRGYYSGNGLLNRGVSLENLVRCSWMVSRGFLA